MEPQGRGSAEEPGIVQRHAQGCVERLRGLVDPKLPLSAPTGVQLAPTSPKLVEGEFCEPRVNGVHGCSLYGRILAADSSSHCRGPRYRPCRGTRCGIFAIHQHVGSSIVRDNCIETRPQSISSTSPSAAVMVSS